ncbi:unnamed protein product [Closterium sp. Yama58-4]|nr:unnamed protein product [Closterium sp. Yama58-4]
MTQSSRVQHSAQPNSLSRSLRTTAPVAAPTAPPAVNPIAPHNPLTSPPASIPSPSSHCHSAAPLSPTSLITRATSPLPSVPSTGINRCSPHSLPSFPSLSALQSALHTPPTKAPPTLSDPSQHHLSQRYSSRSASPSNAASSASVDCSPPSSQTSSQPPSQRTAAPVESQKLQAAATLSAGNDSAAPHPAAAATALPTLVYHAAMDASHLSPSALAAQHMRPHKIPRTSRGVLPPDALEFARSFFSGLPGRDDSQGGESCDVQQTLERTCTSERKCLASAGEGLPSLDQPSLSDMVTTTTAEPGVIAAPGVTAAPDVADSPAAMALAAAAEGICQGEVSIWTDLIELEGEAEGVECGVEKRAGITVGSFCELEDLLEGNGDLL